MAKYTLEQLKARPNSSYWLKKADEAFMVQFRGLECEFCKALGHENRVQTVFHHIIAKKHSKALRYDKRNGIILCPSHHKLGCDMAVHSATFIYVERWIEFFKEHFLDRYNWCEENRRLNFRYTYKEAFEAFGYGATQYTEKEANELIGFK